MYVVHQIFYSIPSSLWQLLSKLWLLSKSGELWYRNAMQISFKENRKTNKNIQNSHIWLILLFFSAFRYLSWTKLKLLRFALSLRTQSPKIEMFQQVCFSVVTRTSSLLTSLHYLCLVFLAVNNFSDDVKQCMKTKIVSCSFYPGNNKIM